MAHELSIRENGFVEMAYRASDGAPWHRLGQGLADDASLEEWAPAAGFDFRIQRSRVRYATSRNAADEELAVDDDNHVLFRSDTKARLAIVGAGFNVVQPIETLEFFRDLVEHAGYRISTAGVLQGGRKFWAQAETEGLEANVLGNDKMKGKLLVATACDGSMKTLVKNVTERVVCANTLAMAIGESGREVRVSHKSKFDPADIKGKLGIAIADFETFISQARSLACEPITRATADEFLLPLIAPNGANLNTVEGKNAVRSTAGYRKIMDLFTDSQRGIELAGVRGTAWGLVNAVTEYVDHHRGNAGTTRDNRMNYAWFGEGDKLKSAAFAKALSSFA